MAKEKIEKTEKIIETNVQLRFLKSYVGKLGNYKARKIYQVDSSFAHDFLENGDAVEATE